MCYCALLLSNVWAVASTLGNTRSSTPLCELLCKTLILASAVFGRLLYLKRRNEVVTPSNSMCRMSEVMLAQEEIALQPGGLSQVQRLRFSMILTTCSSHTSTSWVRIRVAHVNARVNVFFQAKEFVSRAFDVPAHSASPNIRIQKTEKKRIKLRQSIREVTTRVIKKRLSSDGYSLCASFENSF